LDSSSGNHSVLSMNTDSCPDCSSLRRQLIISCEGCLEKTSCNIYTTDKFLIIDEVISFS